MAFRIRRAKLLG